MKRIKIPSYTKTQAENDQIELSTVKEQIKLLQQREEELKNRLGAYMEKAITPDRKGHFLFAVTGNDGKPRYLMRQARKKITLAQDRAIAFLKKHKLTSAIREETKIAEEVTQDQIIELAEKHADWMLDTVTVADEAAIAQLVAGGKINMEDFEKLCDTDVSYAMVFLSDKQIQDYQQEKERDQDATTGNGETVHSAERQSRKTVSNRKAR